MNTPHDGQSSSALATLLIRFGLWSLVVYLVLGIVLDALHGFKVAWYLEFETRRLLWTLAHAHGVLVSVLTIGFGFMIRQVDPAPWQRRTAASLLAALVLLPGGFLLGGIYVYGGDPGPGVVLAPIGGALLLVAALSTAIRYRPGRD